TNDSGVGTRAGLTVETALPRREVRHIVANDEADERILARVVLDRRDPGDPRRTLDARVLHRRLHVLAAEEAGELRGVVAREVHGQQIRLRCVAVDVGRDDTRALAGGGVRVERALPDLVVLDFVGDDNG